MSKIPQYPIAAVDEPAPDERRRIESEPPPPDLYLVPSFKFRHELREPLEGGMTAYYRAYPQFAPRRVSSRQARRAAIRNGNY